MLIVSLFYSTFVKVGYVLYVFMFYVHQQPPAVSQHCHPPIRYIILIRVHLSYIKHYTLSDNEISLQYKWYVRRHEARCSVGSFRAKLHLYMYFEMN